MFYEPVSRLISSHSQFQCPRVSVPEWQLESKHAGFGWLGLWKGRTRTGSWRRNWTPVWQEFWDHHQHSVEIGKRVVLQRAWPPEILVPRRRTAQATGTSHPLVPKGPMKSRGLGLSLLRLMWWVLCSSSLSGTHFLTVRLGGRDPFLSTTNQTWPRRARGKEHAGGRPAAGAGASQSQQGGRNAAGDPTQVNAIQKENYNVKISSLISSIDVIEKS